MTDETIASPPDEQSPEPASKGLDALLDKTIDDIEARRSANIEGREQAEEPASKRGNPNRDKPTGRFTTRDSASPAEAPSDGPADVQAAPADTTTADPAQQPVAPSRWSDADKAEFAKLPQEAQEVVLRREKSMEADYTRKTQALAETTKAIQPFVETVQKWSPYLQHRGLNPSQAFDQLLNVEHTLQAGSPEQKRQAIAYLEQHYDVPAANGDAQADLEWVDPHVQTLSQQVQSLQQALSGMAEQNAYAQRQQAEAEFATIGATKAQDGQPKYPHFDRVRQAMIQLVAEGRSDTWDDAYNKAVRLDDELFDQLVKDRERKAFDAEEKRRQEAVQKARGASPVRTSHGVGATRAKGLDAALDGAMSKFGY